ncbi:MAG: hypothetical protein NWF10_03545 [Candidatus Bathyarchaeota archaeon]|nr:hypothetical protein [Candidatus Bathyarchaeota archaeon]
MTSIFGLIVIVYFSLFANSLEEEVAFHNIIVGSAFGAVCIIGSLASIFPNFCAKISSFKIKKILNTSHSAEKAASRGHHYPCNKYLNHILRAGEKYFCATCSGLLIGAGIGIIGSIWYFSGFFHVERISNLVPIGMIAVLFGLFQSIIPKMNGALARFFAGISLVLGSFLMLVSLDQTINNTIVDLFFVAISVFWIFTKINLSQREHRLTCLNCSIKQCRH